MEDRLALRPRPAQDRRRRTRFTAEAERHDDRYALGHSPEEYDRLRA
jgi:hypothetical protein